MRRLLLPLLLAGFTPALAADAPPLTPDAAAMRAHVAFLAADSLRGREAGTADYDVAADYVAARMSAAGLEPAGDSGGWLQRVPLIAVRATTPPVMTLANGGRRVPLTFNQDFTIRTDPAAADLTLDAPVVFAGYGVVDAANGLDDYRGLDVRGAIVAVIYGGPTGGRLPSDVAAHLGARDGKARLAKERGALGIVFVEGSQVHAVYPFDRMKQNWNTTGMAWASPDGRTRDDAAPMLGVVSYAGAEKLFAGYRSSWSQILAADTAGRDLPRGRLPVTLATRQTLEVKRIASSNVVGRLRGSDPRLAAEHVVLSAHLDHVGIGTPVKGDAIHNGAMDNAMGIATMLEVARKVSGGKRPRRSLLFVAVTAEEKGLVGSDYFARHPTVPARSIVANVNLDMPILTYRFRDLVAFGAERSSIGPAATRATREAGFALVPDPQPEQASFTRTDHYSFVRAGVPSVSLVPGPGGPGAAAIRAFDRDHYHRPSDDMTLPIDWSAAARFVEVNAALVRDLGDAPARPTWNRGDYFGTYFKGPMAR